jgi:hypothetical protein
MLRQSMAPRRASLSLHSGAVTVVVAAAALAVAAFLGTREGIRPAAPAVTVAEGQQQTGREMSVLRAQGAGAPQPEIYRHIRPASLDGELRPIPSAETWPAP